MVGRGGGGGRFFEHSTTTTRPTISYNIGGFMGLIHFYSAIIRLAILLALCGQLKQCTLIMMGVAAESTTRGMISYSKFTHMLTD